MASKLQEIEGTFHGERYRNGDFVIGSVGLPKGVKAPGFEGMKVLAIKGESPEPLELHQRYRFYGKFSKYQNRHTGQVEPQFDFQTFCVAMAHDREGVIEYLARAGRGRGMGHGTAEKLWNAHGADVVAMIRDDPAVIQQANPRVTSEQAEMIAAVLREQQATESATIELTNLLAGRGLPRTIPAKAIKKWGNRAAQVIRKDPYRLMAFRGCGFKLCDALWIELGLPADRLRRQALCAWHAVASSSDGHTWHAAEVVAQAIRQSIGSAMARPARAIKLATRLGRMSPNHYGALASIRSDGASGPIAENGSRVWIAEGKLASAEQRLAELVAAANAEKGEPVWPLAETIDGIDDHQREKLGQSLTSRVAVLGGSPGTGKTYATAQLIRAIIASGEAGVRDIAVGAPTGKAAVRITEAMQAAGIPIKARTWHSLLGVGIPDKGDGGWKFLHNEKDPWPFRVVIGDESSMIDTSLMCSIFQARARGCHVLLVGDVHQLPPVGSGAPLRDIIASQCVGYGEMTEIKRNSGGIVEACAAIRDEKPWGEGDNLTFADASTPEGRLELIESLLKKARDDGFDPAWDCQILVAVNDRSPMSRKVLNRHFQGILNRNPEIKGTPFRINDKIVCLKNGRYTAIESEDDAHDEDDGNEVYVANGELGRVLDIEPKSIIAEVQNPRRVIRIPRGKSDGEGDSSSSGCSWDLAYGLTCHKLQGSEAPVVITILDDYPGARRVCDRSWLYTAISRAKEYAMLIGKKTTAIAMCRRVAIGKRKTFLRELVQLETARRGIEEL